MSTEKMPSSHAVIPPMMAEATGKEASQAERLSRMVQRRRPRDGHKPAPHSPAPTPAVTAPHVGTRYTHPAGATSPYKQLTGHFDGREFFLYGDKRLLMQVTAASGRPITVTPADAKACKGGTTKDSYYNNPLYVGIRDKGPIPEGEFHFSAAQLATFTADEQSQIFWGTSFTDPFGKPMHAGDWGAGRAPLTKDRVLPGPCGDTNKRSGFYIHGGSLSGSSGCIDIGNDGVAGLLTHIAGYKGNITVTVKYAYPAPTVGTMQRVLGGATYPEEKNPTIGDRLRGSWRELFGGGDE